MSSGSVVSNVESVHPWCVYAGTIPRGKGAAGGELRVLWKRGALLAALVVGLGPLAGVTRAGTVESAPGYVTQEFRFTGAPQQWTVPPDVRCATFQLYGAQGGSKFSDGRLHGGQGGFAAADLAVTPGDVLTVRVGGVGKATAGGYNGGGTPGNSIEPDPIFQKPGDFIGGGGGGATDVRRGGDELGDRILVAGGGGGAGYQESGAFFEGGAGGGAFGREGLPVHDTDLRLDGAIGAGQPREFGPSFPEGEGGRNLDRGKRTFDGHDGDLGVGGFGGRYEGVLGNSGGGGGGGGYYGGGGGATNEGDDGGSGSGGSGAGPPGSMILTGVESYSGRAVISYTPGGTPACRPLGTDLPVDDRGSDVAAVPVASTPVATTPRFTG
jgi:hypothetical protein